RVRGIAAEMEIGLAGMAQRPFADAVVQIEQAGLVGHFGARLGRNQPPRRGRRDRRLGVAGSLANEAAGADRAILDAVWLDALRGPGVRRVGTLFGCRRGLALAV